MTEGIRGRPAVLVTDGMERSALAAVRSLGSVFRVHVGSAGGRSLAGASRHAADRHALADPLDDPEAFRADVQALVAASGIAAVLPMTDASTRALLPIRADLAPVWLAAANQAAYERLSDKAACLAVGARHGIEGPPGGTAQNADEAEKIAKDLGWPVVIKPLESVRASAEGVGTKHGVAFAADPGELRPAWRESAGDGPALVQRVVPGWGEGLCLLRWGGRTLAVSAHRRLRERPPAGGVSCLRETIPIDPVLQRAVEGMLDDVDGEGLAMAEFRTDGTRQWLMEFNVRPWGSMQLAIDAGADFPGLWLAAALGDPSPETAVARPGFRSRWLLGELDRAIAMSRGATDTAGRAGFGAALVDLLKPAGPNCRWEVLRRNDPAPFRVELREWFAQLRRK